MLLAGLTTLGACDSTSRSRLDETRLASKTGYVSPYNWNNLVQENGRFVYQIEGKKTSRTGIDVSSHQGAINWQEVAGDGIDFAFIRLGNRGFSQGQLYLDDFFEQNYEGATTAGLPVGIYFFSQALDVQEAQEEARFVLAQLNGRALEYPVAYDFEPVSDAQGRANHLDGHDLTSNALAFCEVIEEAGYSTMIYGNTRDISLLYREVLGKRPVWFAEYDASYPSGPFDFAIWQYTSSGQVLGIATRVDMNIELISSASKG